MSIRSKIVLGQMIGLVWALAVVGLPLAGTAPFIPLNTVMIMALLPVGLVLLAMIGMIATRRLFDPGVIAGGALRPGSRAEIDQRALWNTVEQLALALTLWPFVALTLGGAVVIWMGIGLALARLLYWLGYHLSPLVKSVGFGASFYPTVLATLWAVLKWAA